MKWSGVGWDDMFKMCEFLKFEVKWWIMMEWWVLCKGLMKRKEF